MQKQPNFTKAKLLLKELIEQYQEQTNDDSEYNIVVNKDELLMFKNLKLILRVTKLKIDGKKNKKTNFHFLENDSVFAW